MSEMKLMPDKELLQKFLCLPYTPIITEYAAQQDMNTPPGLYFKNGAKAQLAADQSWHEAKEKEWQEEIDAAAVTRNALEIQLNELQDKLEQEAAWLERWFNADMLEYESYEDCQRRLGKDLESHISQLRQEGKIDG